MIHSQNHPAKLELKTEISIVSKVVVMTTPA